MNNHNHISCSLRPNTFDHVLLTQSISLDYTIRFHIYTMFLVLVLHPHILYQRRIESDDKVHPHFERDFFLQLKWNEYWFLAACACSFFLPTFWLFKLMWFRTVVVCLRCHINQQASRFVLSGEPTEVL